MTSWLRNRGEPPTLGFQICLQRLNLNLNTGTRDVKSHNPRQRVNKKLPLVMNVVLWPRLVYTQQGEQ